MTHPPAERIILPAGVSFPRTLYEVTSEFDRRLREGNLANYRPIATGFSPLDDYLGGGLQSEDLVLLGGPQGVGKTVAVLQMARNIAKSGRAAIVVCFEHSEVYLYHRLMGLESVDPTSDNPQGMTRTALRDAVLRALEAGIEQRLGLDWVLSQVPGAQKAWDNLLPYWDHLYLVRGSSRRTTVDVLEKYILWARDQGHEDVALFVDYLQKVSYIPPIGVPEPDTLVRVGHVIAGLKDVALTTGAPAATAVLRMVAVAAADEEGLRGGQIHLANLLGPSLVQYECDTAIILNPVPGSPQKVVWSIEKNRSGATGVQMAFNLLGPYFCFNPNAMSVRLK
jgi:replicative DNA helicase